MYTVSCPVKGIDFREVGLVLDESCMSAADYLSDCHPKLNMGEICEMYLCIDAPSSLPGKRVDDICKASLRWLHCL